MKAFMFGCIGVFCLLVLSLWPVKGGIWIIQFSNTFSQQSAMAYFKNNKMAVIQYNGNARYIVKTDTTSSLLSILSSDITFIIDASYSSACSTTFPQRSPFAKSITNKTRQPTQDIDQ